MSVYLITGATRGIGLATARALAGHTLVLVGRDHDALDRICAQLPDARAVVADLARPDEIASICAAANLPPRIDGVVHAAASSVWGRLEELSLADWRRALEINVLSAARLTTAIMPALRAAHGTVVFLNSGAGERVARPGGGGYATTKFALRALADTLRLEQPDLRIASVFPGRAATDMQAALKAYEGQPYEPAELLRPESVAAAVMWALTAPPDADVQEIRIRPTGRITPGR